VTLTEIRDRLARARTLQDRAEQQIAVYRDQLHNRRVLGRTKLASASSALPSAPPRNILALVSQERPDIVAPYDTRQPIPPGYYVVPVSELKRPTGAGFVAIGPRAEVPALHTAEVRRPAPPLPIQRARVAREPRRPREPRKPRGARPPRKPRPPRAPRPPRPPRKPRQYYARNRKPRKPRVPRKPRAKKTKGREIPGICRIQCGGRPGACWNTGVCISGLVPYPAHIGSCCFPRSYKCVH
jgi:hypothetical protein